MVPRRKKRKPHVWLAVLHRDGPHCRYCGKACEDFGWYWPAKGLQIRPWFSRFQLDHYIPHCEGGADDSGNLVVACESCNRKKWKGAAPPLLPPKPFALGPPQHVQLVDHWDRGPWRG